MLAISHLRSGTDVALAAYMLVRGRSRTALCLSVISFLFTPAIVKRQDETHASVSAVPVTIASDRGNKKTLREIKVNLHGETGEVKILAERNPEFDPEWDDESDAYKNVRGIGLGPWEYNRRLHDIILRFAEPAGHIKRTSAGRRAGW